MILARDAAQQEVLQQNAETANNHGRDEKRYPVVDAEGIKNQYGTHGTEHVHGAMGEINDFQQAKYNRQAEAQQSIKGAIDHPEHQLARQHGHGDSQNLGHVTNSKSSATDHSQVACLQVSGRPAPVLLDSAGRPSRSEHQFWVTSLHLLSDSGR